MIRSKIISPQLAAGVGAIPFDAGHSSQLVTFEQIDNPIGVWRSAVVSSVRKEVAAEE
jgi:hypothetical protein